MTRRTLVAGNWKMNTSWDAAVALADGLADVTAGSNVDVAVFPPFPWLVPVRQRLEGSSVMVGAQNCYIRPSGAFTGEVSAEMLAGVCDFVLAGHSERRHVFNESDALVGEKVQAILGAGLRAVLCVGETLDEREARAAQAVVQRQLEAGLTNRSAENLASIVVAYEPVWAIGTGLAATPDDAQEMCAFIRQWLSSRFSDAGTNTLVLYGGSVTPENARTLFTQADIDGGLVGGASLNAESFRAIVDAATS